MWDSTIIIDTSYMNSSSTQRRGYPSDTRDDGYTTPPSVAERDVLLSILTHAEAEQPISGALSHLLKMLIRRAAETSPSSTTATMAGIADHYNTRIAKLEAANAELSQRIEHLNTTFSQEIHELHRKANHLEGNWINSW